MLEGFLQHVDTQSAAALASGDLLPVQAKQISVQEQNMPFVVRWVSTLAQKDASRQSVPGGPRDPNFNPFLPPDPMLTVGDYFMTHNTVLNKYALSPQHLVLATKQFVQQLSPLDLADFSVLAQILHHCDGLGFYNGGEAGGASQPHKHIQWIPALPQAPSLALYLTGLPEHAQPGEQHKHAALAYQHVFIRLPYDEHKGWGCADELGPALLQAHQTGCVVLGLRPDMSGLLPAHNMLVGQGWMLLLPRSQESVSGISINALSYGGCIYVREPEQQELVRRMGPLQLLAQAACCD